MLRKVLEDRPENIDVHIKLKDIYLRTGMMTEAASECIALERIHEARGENERARDYAVRASRLTQLIEQPSGDLSEPTSKPVEAPARRLNSAPIEATPRRDTAPLASPVLPRPEPRPAESAPMRVAPANLQTVEAPTKPVELRPTPSPTRVSVVPSSPLPTDAPTKPVDPRPTPSPTRVSAVPSSPQPLNAPPKPADLPPTQAPMRVSVVPSGPQASACRQNLRQSGDRHFRSSESRTCPRRQRQSLQFHPRTSLLLCRSPSRSSGRESAKSPLVEGLSVDAKERGRLYGDWDRGRCFSSIGYRAR